MRKLGAQCPLLSWGKLASWQCILWGFTGAGCDYADLSGVEQEPALPSLCCLTTIKEEQPPILSINSVTYSYGLY